MLPAPTRSGSGYRHYTQTAVRNLEFIKKAQGLGFTLEEVHEILELSRAGKAPCTRVLDAAQRHLLAVEERIAALTRFRDELQAELVRWRALEQPVRGGVCQMIAGAAELIPPAELRAPRPSRDDRRADVKGRRRASSLEAR